MVDALALGADEGRGKPAISLGEVEATFDPGMSEWGNPAGYKPVILCRKNIQSKGNQVN